MPVATTRELVASPSTILCPLAAQAAVTVSGAEPGSELVLWFPGERDREEWAVADDRGVAHFLVSPVAVGPQLVEVEQWSGSFAVPAQVLLVGQ